MVHEKQENTFYYSHVKTLITVLQYIGNNSGLASRSSTRGEFLKCCPPPGGYTYPPSGGSILESIRGQARQSLGP